LPKAHKNPATGYLILCKLTCKTNFTCNGSFGKVESTLYIKGACEMNSKQYLKELGLALLAYGAVLIGSSTWLIVDGSIASPWRDLTALSPMLPGALVVWAILRQLRRLDELQRQVQFEALAFAFAGTAFISFSYGFLETHGYPRLSMFVIWPLMASLWMLGLMLAARRYK
jgi:hypothetical protein